MAMLKRTHLQGDMSTDGEPPIKRARLSLEASSVSPYFNRPEFSDCVLLLEEDPSLSGHSNLDDRSTAEQPGTDEKAPTLADQLRKQLANRPSVNQPVLVAPLHEGSPKEAKQYFLHVSKIVLVANSRFFEKLFTSGMKETGKNEVRIYLTSPFRYFIDMIRFLYVGEFEIPVNELMEVWRLADQFEVDRVLQSAAERIGRQEFTLDLSLEILNIPEILTREELGPILAKASDVLINNLAPLSEGIDPNLVSLPLPAFLRFISKEHNPRIATTENDYLTAVVMWLDANKDPEGARFTLLKCIRFPFLTKSFMAGMMPILLNERGTLTCPTALLLDFPQRCELERLVSMAYHFQTVAQISCDKVLPSKWLAAISPPLVDPSFVEKRVSYQVTDPISPFVHNWTFDISEAKFSELALDPMNFELPSDRFYWNGVTFILKLVTDPGGLLRLKCYCDSICGRRPDTLFSVFLPLNIRLEWPLRNRLTTSEDFVFNVKGTISKSSMELFERLTIESMRVFTEQLTVRVVISIPPFDWFEQNEYFKTELKWT